MYSQNLIKCLIIGKPILQVYIKKEERKRGNCDKYVNIDGKQETILSEQLNSNMLK